MREIMFIFLLAFFLIIALMIGFVCVFIFVMKQTGNNYKKEQYANNNLKNTNKSYKKESEDGPVQNL